MSSMDLDSTESGPDGGYADMDMDEVHSSTDTNTLLTSTEQKVSFRNIIFSFFLVASKL